MSGYTMDEDHHLLPYDSEHITGYNDQMERVLYDHAMYSSYDHFDVIPPITSAGCWNL